MPRPSKIPFVPPGAPKKDPKAPSCAKCRELTTVGGEASCKVGGPLEPCEKFDDASKDTPTPPRPGPNYAVRWP